MYDGLKNMSTHAGNTERIKILHRPDVALGVGEAEHYFPMDTIIKYVLPRYKKAVIKDTDDTKFEVKRAQLDSENFPILEYEGEDIYD